MKLPTLSFFKKKIIKDYFLALLLRDEKVAVILFEETSGNIQIIKEEQENLHQPLESIPFDELITIIDKAISKIDALTPTNVEVKKTVFGLKESWTEDSKIKKENLIKLKKISEELDLQPVGFLVFSEAICHLLQKEEGVPISAILVDAGNYSISVSLVRAGKIIQTKQALIETSTPQAVDNLLKHIEAELLPSRIILFEENDNRNIVQEFINHTWSKTLPFLHVPQITLLPKDFDARAILVGTATQMGFEAPLVYHKKENNLPINEPIKENQTFKLETEINETESDNFGFVKDQDIARQIKEEKAETPKEELKIDHDHKKSQLSIINLEQFSSLLKHLSKNISSFLKKLNILPIKKSSTENTSILKNKKIFLAIGFLIIIIAGGVIFYIFNLKAIITLSVTPKEISDKQNITFTSTSDTKDKNTITGDLVSVSEDGSLQTAATGTKEIGDKAKGTVTIFNLGDAKTLTAGTIINSSTGLKFAISQDVKVASGSSDPLNPQAGKTDAKITASDIGSEYNLPSNTKFSFDSDNSVAAKNTDPLTGGTKKEITVVSQKDLNKLLADIEKSLEEKAKNDLQTKINKPKVLLPFITNEEITKKTFDHKLLDETKTVSLTATISYEALAYDQNNIQSYLQNLLKKYQTSDTTLPEKYITYQISDLKLKNNDINGSLSAQAKLFPIIKTDDLARNIAGKSFLDATSQLKQLPQINNVNILLRPNLFFLPKILPRISSNIQITQKQ